MYVIFVIWIQYSYTFYFLLFTFYFFTFYYSYTFYTFILTLYTCILTLFDQLHNRICSFHWGLFCLSFPAKLFMLTFNTTTFAALCIYFVIMILWSSECKHFLWCCLLNPFLLIPPIILSPDIVFSPFPYNVWVCVCCHNIWVAGSCFSIWIATFLIFLLRTSIFM